MKQYIDLFGNIVVEEEAPTVDENELDIFMNCVKTIYETNGTSFLLRLIRQMRHDEILSGRTEENTKKFTSIT